MPDEIEQLKDRHFLEGTVERFEDKMAVIITKDGQRLRWPINQLPDDVEAGSAVRVILSSSKSDQEDREKIAKAILNQILKDNN